MFQLSIITIINLGIVKLSEFNTHAVTILFNHYNIYFTVAIKHTANKYRLCMPRLVITLCKIPQYLQHNFEVLEVLCNYLILEFNLQDL